MRFSYSAFCIKSIRNLLFYWAAFFCFDSNSQTLDTIDLHLVEIKTTKITFGITGRKFQNIDSSTLDLFKNQTLADLLIAQLPYL